MCPGNNISEMKDDNAAWLQWYSKFIQNVW